MVTKQLQLGNKVNLDNRIFSRYLYKLNLTIIEIQDKTVTLLTVSNQAIFGIPKTAITKILS